jgi:hypothetical protein
MRGSNFPLFYQLSIGVNMTKTMRVLLDRAINNPRGFGLVQTVCGNGSHGARVNRGSRELSALNALIELELVKVVKRNQSVLPNRGNTLFINDTIYQCTVQMPSDNVFMSALGACNK